MSRKSTMIIAAVAAVAMVTATTQSYAGPVYGGGSHIRAAGPGFGHGMRHGHGFRHRGHGGNAGLAIGLGLLAIGAIAAAAQAAPQAQAPEQVGPCHRSNLDHYRYQRDNARHYYNRWLNEISPDNPGYKSSLARYREWFDKANRCIVALEGPNASQALAVVRR